MDRALFSVAGGAVPAGRGVSCGCGGAMLTAMAVPAAGTAAASPPQKPVPVHVVPHRPVKVPVMTPWKRPAVSWPAAGTATVTLAGAGASAGAATAAQAGPGRDGIRAGRLPVWAGPPAGGSADAASRATLGAPSSVTVSMQPQPAAQALGIPGVLFTVGRADGKAAASRVHISLSYSSFADAYGGITRPGCAWWNCPARDHATAARLSGQIPLASADNVRTAELGADLPLPFRWRAAARRGSDGAARSLRQRRARGGDRRSYDLVVRVGR